MPNNHPTFQVIALPNFTRQLKQLVKKYQNIRSDIQPTLDALQSGETPGDRIPDIPYTVYKQRVPNTDAKRGKSGGYRIIYYIRTETMILLFTIYTKSDVSDVPVATLIQWIKEYEELQKNISDNDNNTNKI